jgi:hypothetical protein
VQSLKRSKSPLTEVEWQRRLRRLIIEIHSLYSSEGIYFKVIAITAISAI